MKRTNSGVTLIALIITIIVLLILAGVTIAMIMGDNGILNQATRASEETIIADEKETISLALAGIKTKLESVGKDNLQSEINSLKGAEVAEVTEKGENLLEVRFKETGHTYLVDKDGNLIDLDTKLNATYKLEEGRIYISPYIENLDAILEVIGLEEWLNSLLADMTQEEKENMFLDSWNILVKLNEEIPVGGPYNSIDELLAGEGYESIDKLIQSSPMFEGIEVENLNDVIYILGSNGECIVENPDGSLEYGSLDEEGETSGYPVEMGQTYTFKLRFMGIEIEKEIKAEDYSDWEWEVNEDGETITVTSYKGSSTEVTIPSEIYGMKVTEIGSGEGYLSTVAGSTAYYDSIWNESISEYKYVSCGMWYAQETITKVVIPEGVTTINSGAFVYSYRLEKVVLPSTLKIIGECAFWNCTNLTDINFLTSITNIGSYAFHGCHSLSSKINISDEITKIEDGTFEGCSNLTSINIPDSVTSIGESAFRECANLIDINIPNSVISMGDYVFNQCTNLTTINIEATSIPSSWNANWKGNCTATVNTGVAMD